jgi:GNAT superfamily N-acetyltransferase
MSGGIAIRHVVDCERDRAAFVALVREYTAWLGEDLCYQNLEQELSSLSCYAPPGGCMLLASLAGVGDVGMVAVRHLPQPQPGFAALPGAAGQRSCEIKRLYVKPQHQGMGVGSALVQAAQRHAACLGYRCDTGMHGHGSVRCNVCCDHQHSFV